MLYNSPSALLPDSKLSNGNIVSDLNKEIAKLQTSYNAAVRSRDEARKQLEVERRQHQVTKWEHAHVTIRIRDYVNQVDQIESEIASLKSHLPMISERLVCFNGCTCYCCDSAFGTSSSPFLWHQERAADTACLDGLSWDHAVSTSRSPTQFSAQRGRRPDSSARGWGATWPS